MVTESQRRLLALCAIRVDGKSVDWNLIARQVLADNGVDLLYRGHVIERSKVARASEPILRAGLKDMAAAEQRVTDELALAATIDAKLVTVLDDEYPVNLRLIPNLPPFLFYRGQLDAHADALSVAVVGTRKASPEGVVRATKMASLLTANGVTVTSGLAEGIDAAAHRAALDAGGRTVAVLGTGITKHFPAKNKDLAEEIVQRGGALLSQFWPSTRPATWTFPRRNVVTSGLSQGTVVIEATSTSGAKMQARLAIEHKKRVWLISSLVMDQVWARNYLERGAVEVSSVEDVLKDLAAPERLQRAAQQQRQLVLEVL